MLNYIKNAIWNYGFWLFAKKIYKNIEYKKNIQNFNYNDNNFRIEQNNEIVKKKRFIGYFYKNNIFLDNYGRSIKKHRK